VPRGALSLDPAKKVISNSNFQGLSFATSSELRAFLHMRSPMRLRGQAIMNKPGILKTDDFLDCIDMDGPKGKTIFLYHHFLIQLLIIFLLRVTLRLLEMWCISHDNSAATVFVRNLYWDGFSFYSVLKSTEYGCAYFGNGVPNYDIAFMM
jgi:hypothetical protein